MDNTSLLKNLNQEQLNAVTYPSESVLVLAGAGSGKTRVLTTRIAWLLSTQQASVNSVLAVTFTNKAAKEMSIRLSSMLHFSVNSMWLGTFHGLCHRFLRLHSREAKLPSSFQIIDTQDQLSVVKRVLKESNISEQLIAPRSLQGFINAQKESGLRSSALSANDSYTQSLIECYAAYDALCQREGLVDFAELLLRSFEVLQQDDVLRQHYQKRFTHILVDEFQDTNKLQYAWLKLLADGGATIFAVGDDDQSIYRFRGANVGNMSSLIKDFSIDKPIKLEQNYRSVGCILHAANAIISNNKNRLGKQLRTDEEDGDKIRFFHAVNDLYEAKYVVEEIKNLHEKNNIPLCQIAVLYRNNAQSRVLEQELFASGLSYRIYGGLRFYERQEIKHVLAYLRLSINEDDDNAFLRIINVPTRGIGIRTVENIQAQAQIKGISLLQAARELSVRSPKISSFVQLIEKINKSTQENSLPETIALTIKESQLEQYYLNQKGEHHERLENLNELINAAMAFRVEEHIIENTSDNTQHNTILLSFLSNAALEAGEHQAGANEDAVQLMTIHSAKGLEFDAVFLTGAEEGLFPSEYSLAEHGGEEEERRLMYVAVTRARQHLYISASQQRILHGQTLFPLISRFVDEIPDELIHNLSKSSNKPIYYIKENKEDCLLDNQDFDGFCIGENVRHTTFGTGVIVDAVDKNGSANLTINFGRNGIKIINTAFVKDKLTKCV